MTQIVTAQAPSMQHPGPWWIGVSREAWLVVVREQSRRMACDCSRAARAVDSCRPELGMARDKARPRVGFAMPWGLA